MGYEARRLRRSFTGRNSPNPFSDDKPDRSFTVIKFWMDATSGVALELKAVPAVNQGNRLVKHRLDSVAAGSRRS
jgi:hypothetical protein